MSWISKTSQGSAVNEAASNYSITQDELEALTRTIGYTVSDTIASRREEEISEYNKTHKSLDKAELPPSNSNPGNGDYLSTLAEAFSAIYSSMSKTVQDQLNGQQSIIQLDQTMSQCILTTNNNNINQLNKSNAKIAQLEADQKKEQKDDALWSKISMVLGVIMIAGSIALAIATGGASAAAEAPLMEMEMTEMTPDLLETTTQMPENMSDVPLEDMDSEANQPKVNNVDNEDGSIFERSQSKWGSLNDSYENPELQDENAQTKQQSEEQLQESSKGANKAKAVLTRLAKCLLGAGLGTVSAMPNIYQAKANFAIAKVQSELAGIIGNMGTAQAATQENNMFYQFYQQIVQRGAQMIQQLGEQASSVVEIDGTVMGAYQQIAISLAQSNR